MGDYGTQPPLFIPDSIQFFFSDANVSKYMNNIYV